MRGTDRERDAFIEQIVAEAHMEYDIRFGIGQENAPNIPVAQADGDPGDETC